MSPNKPYVHELRSELNNNHQSVIVSFYVKNIVLITNIIY